jgi:hypothetical protein
MPHYFLSGEDSFVDQAFDAFEFMLADGTQSVEGHRLYYDYSFDESAGNSPSFLQIIRNYEAAAKRIGGQVLWDDVRRATIRISKNGQETWVAVEAFNDGREYSLNIIEKQAMEPDVVANAEALQSGLNDAGHVEVPGIFFDSGGLAQRPIDAVRTHLQAGQQRTGQRARATDLQGRCRPVQVLGVLGVVSGHHVRAELHGSRVGRLESEKHPQQRRLARTVRPDDRQPLAARQVKRDPGEQRLAWVGLGQVRDRQCDVSAARNPREVENRNRLLFPRLGRFGPRSARSRSSRAVRATFAAFRR